MPPQRTIPLAKAVKTERTHEENQERAYIAASRRSDRSLEARVESARRASEIHKRRTGRSLRVTEQDVVNEEMYEEEDDDLPLQYRRLTAHLQTGSPDFNRRLAAYLTNHVAMRSALDHAITQSYAQQYPNNPQFAHNHPSIYPSPFPMQQQMMQPPQSPSVYRQSPYPIPGSGAHRPMPHGRSASIAVPNGMEGQDQSKDGMTSPAQPAMLGQVGRRMSMPATTSTPMMASPHMQQLNTQLPTSAGALSTDFRLLPKNGQSGVHSQPQSAAQGRSAYDFGILPQAFLPLSTSLPAESQQLLGQSLDPNDPLTSMMMAGAEQMNIPPYYNFVGNYAMGKPTMLHHSYDGINATLAPSALEISPQTTSEYATQTEPNSASTFFSYDNPDNGDFKPPKLNRDSTQGSSTSGFEGEWNSFIDDNSWDASGSS